MSYNPRNFDDLAKTVFAPLHPVIAQQIVNRCKIKEGICIDVGSGPAPLAIALAKITNMKIYALDISEEMCKIAKENVKESRLSGKIIPILGDVEDMPFSDDFADLIVSRGSVFFWDDKVKVFKEIYRVLKPSGMAYIGGGFGIAELRDKIAKEMEKRDSNWKKDVKERLGKNNVERLKEELAKANISNYEIIHDDSGFWILIRKAKNEM
jgi:ubiquinone/menaquinone biosynthesis C-methylase UbiE